MMALNMKRDLPYHPAGLFLFPLLNPERYRNQTLHAVRHMPAGGIGSRKGKGPTQWEGPPAGMCLTVCPSG